MKNGIAAILLAAALAGAGGCRSRADVPADFEPIYDLINFHECECWWEYPYSCPPCPYYDYRFGVWRYPWPLEPVRPYYEPPAVELEGAE